MHKLNEVILHSREKLVDGWGKMFKAVIFIYIVRRTILKIKKTAIIKLIIQSFGNDKHRLS